MLSVKAILIIVHQSIHSDSLPPFFTGGNTIFNYQFCIHAIISGIGLPGVGEEEFLSNVEELKQCLAARTSLDEVDMS